MFRGLFLCLILCVPASLPAADKDMVLLQRYVSNLEEAVRNLQKSLDEKFAASAQKQADQLHAAQADTAKALTELGDRFQKDLQGQRDAQSQSVSSLAALTSRMQEVTTDLGDLKEAMTALTTAITRLSTQVKGVEDAIKVMSAPAPQPPQAAQPSMSAKDMFDNAERDYQGGNFDIAIQGFQEVLKWYPNSPSAPSAQYRIGFIQYSSKQYDDAIKSLDLLITNYPDSERVPEALFYKFKAYVDTGRGADATGVYNILRKNYPNNPATRQAAAIKIPGGK